MLHHESPRALWVLLLVAAGWGQLGCEQGVCQASSAQGKLTGKAAGETCEYLGIPYAKPPTGTRRFAPPEPAPNWAGTRDATRFGARCVQASLPPLGTLQSEDCLFLNVYTPRTPASQPLPVMVFIHGGGGTSGASNQYDAQLLSEQGPAVVVTLNYRLGVFGFLALPSLDAARPGAPSGLDAMRDQQVALRWIQANIADFNGDPSNVTLFGESAGALSTCVHLVSPGSVGLGQRYIMQSGFCTGAAIATTRDNAHAIGTALVDTFCPAGADPVACLRGVDAGQLISWTPPPTSGVTVPTLGPFGAIVEGPGGVLPDLPENLIARGEYDRDAEIVIGTVKNEWGRFDSPLYTPTTVSAFHAAIERAFPSDAPAVKSLYPVATDLEVVPAFDALMSDYTFVCPTRRLARSLLAHGTRDLFLYSYEVGRAFHADELLALFRVSFEPFFFLGATIPSASFQESMRGYWTRFAASGDPNGAGTPEWPRYSTSEDRHLVLAENTVVSAGLRKTPCDFWDAYVPPPAAP